MIAPYRIAHNDSGTTVERRATDTATCGALTRYGNALAIPVRILTGCCEKHSGTRQKHARRQTQHKAAIARVAADILANTSQ